MTSREYLRNSGTTRWIAILLGSAFVLPGCSGRLPTYPVSGRVEFNTGGVVHVGTIELKSREHDVQARGSINTDGTFELTTYDPGDGAVAGMHDCVLVQFVMTEDIPNHKPSTVGVVDRRYSSYATSDLEVEILPQADNEILLKVDGLTKQPEGEHHH